MARTFGDPYDIEVPLRTTWRESVVFQDPSGVPVSIKLLSARGNVCEVLGYDEAGNRIYGAPILQLSTADGSLEIPNDDSGVLNINVPATTIGDLSADNTMLQADYDIEFFDGSGYIEPALAGTVTFTQRVKETP